MTTLKIRNSFNAPVYHEETVSSTMDISRTLAGAGEKHGTVITADFQEAGRGRVRDRQWQMNRVENLPFTLLLRYPRAEDIPSALTLRVGLAVSLAIENFEPPLCGSVFVKWPNDIMIGKKKAAGILCEAENGIVHVGVGINVAQKNFPAALREKATSIALAANADIAPDERFLLLEKILSCLFDELEAAKVADNEDARSGGAKDWKTRLDQRLYKKGEKVVFVEGEADSQKEVRGTLTGIGEVGELLIAVEGETDPRSFITGELKY